jgi:nucleoside-diphosphate-sugar epimerase
MRVGEISRYVADITRARTLLEYAPRYRAERGIPEFYQWWSSHHGQ